MLPGTRGTPEMSFPAPVPLPGRHLHLPISQRRALGVNMNLFTCPFSQMGSSCSLHFPGICNMVMERVLTAHNGNCPPCNVRSCKGANKNIYSTGQKSPPVGTLHSGLHYRGLCTSIHCRFLPPQGRPCVRYQETSGRR